MHLYKLIMIYIQSGAFQKVMTAQPIPSDFFPSSNPIVAHPDSSGIFHIHYLTSPAHPHFQGERGKELVIWLKLYLKSTLNEFF